MADISSEHLVVGGIVFPGVDQADFTGPFEVLSRLPESSFFVIGKYAAPVRDAKGLVLTPEISYADAPSLDVLLVPGGSGVNALMEDEQALSFIRRQAAGARLVLSVCTGALVLGAAGILEGRRATTHWASHCFLRYFGAIPENARVVVDGNLVTAAGVTSGIDAALTAAAILRGPAAAEQIQLYMEYAPDPPFDAGTPASAPPDVLEAVRALLRNVTDERRKIAERVAAKLGVRVDS